MICIGRLAHPAEKEPVGYLVFSGSSGLVSHAGCHKTSISGGAPEERRRRRAEKRLSKRVFLESPFPLCPLKKVFRTFQVFLRTNLKGAEKKRTLQKYPFGQPFLRTTPSLLLWRTLNIINLVEILENRGLEPFFTALQGLCLTLEDAWGTHLSVPMKSQSQIAASSNRRLQIATKTESNRMHRRADFWSNF